MVSDTDLLFKKKNALFIYAYKKSGNKNVLFCITAFVAKSDFPKINNGQLKIYG